MAIQYCKSFVAESLEGVHDFRTDTFKAALFGTSVDFDENTTAYAATGEVSDSGYTAGGGTLVLSTGYPTWEFGKFCVRWEQLSWRFQSPVTMLSTLIYNSSKANRAILSIDMGSGQTVWGNFSLNFPLSEPALISQGAPNIT